MSVTGLGQQKQGKENQARLFPTKKEWEAQA
jgi:hypothetical protein